MRVFRFSALCFVFYFSAMEQNCNSGLTSGCRVTAAPMTAAARAAAAQSG